MNWQPVWLEGQASQATNTNAAVREALVTLAAFTLALVAVETIDRKGRLRQLVAVLNSL